MIPGLLSESGAAVRNRPYRSNISGENNINPTEDTMPTRIDAAMPCLVVPFQNNSMIIAGRFADAAIAQRASDLARQCHRSFADAYMATLAGEVNAEQIATFNRADFQRFGMSLYPFKN